MSSGGFTSISVRVRTARDFTRLREEKDYSSTEMLQILIGAYDVINGTGHGGHFSEAVKRAYAEVARMVPT